MLFTKEYIGGALRIERRQVWVYKVNSNSFIRIPCGREVVSAMWVGNTVQVTLDTGWVRLYSGQGTFKQLPPVGPYKRGS